MANTNIFLQCTLFIKYCEFNTLDINIQHCLCNDYWNNICITNPVSLLYNNKCAFFDIINQSNTLCFYNLNLSFDQCNVIYNKVNTSCVLNQWIKYCNKKIIIKQHIIYYFPLYILFFCMIIYHVLFKNRVITLTKTSP